MSVLVVLKLSKTIHYRILECICIVHICWNVELRNKHFKNRVDAINASISCNQYLINFLDKLILTYIIDTVGVHCGLLKILI